MPDNDYEKHSRGGGSISSDGDLGDGIASRRMNLLDASKGATPQIGRREPEQYDPWPKRKQYIKWISAAAIVVIVAVVLLVLLGGNSALG